LHKHCFIQAGKQTQESSREIAFSSCVPKQDVHSGVRTLVAGKKHSFARKRNEIMETTQVNTKQFANFVRTLPDDTLAQMFSKSLGGGGAIAQAPAKKGPGRPKGSSNGVKAAKTNGAEKKAPKAASAGKKPGRPKSESTDEIANNVFQFVTKFKGPVAAGDVIDGLELDRPIVSRVLGQLVTDEKLEKHGAGRGTKYTVVGAEVEDSDDDDSEED
ncbi:hypothetical protein L0244_39460, partial [bacterium]|nr:hypothetical protein [bacterium]